MNIMGNSSSTPPTIAEGIFKNEPTRQLACELRGEAKISDHYGRVAIGDIEKCGIKLLKYQGWPALNTGLFMYVEGTEEQLQCLIRNNYGWLGDICVPNLKLWANVDDD